MRRLTSFVAAVVMFLMMVPVLACAATPAASTMNRMEQDCCRQMHGDCGEMSKQGCCQVEVRSDLHQIPSAVVTAPTLPITTMVVLYALMVELPPDAVYRWHLPAEHSPPGLLVATTTVLRV